MVTTLHTLEQVMVKLVCSLIGRIMAEDIDGDNLTYSIASYGKVGI